MHLYSALLCIAVHPKHFTIMCNWNKIKYKNFNNKLQLNIKKIQLVDKTTFFISI